VKAAIAAGEPAISVDTKKKELIGDFKNAGRELRRQGDPEQVRVHDFKLPELGKVAPYGVYDIAANHGWVSVGIDADTGAFAVESIRRWWQKLGRQRYPDATRLVITADCGGSNGPQLKLWKRELQRFANETGLKINVAHLPPGTSSRVGDWRGGSRSRGYLLSGGFRLCRCLISSDRSSVSSRRSSNRTCRFPASGFLLRRQAFALGRSARRCGKAYRPSVS
jgi:hypothetical protein